MRILGLLWGVICALRFIWLFLFYSAFQSARSKFPHLDDILSNFHGNAERKQKIIEGYKFEITEEITKDFNKAFGVTKETIEAHVEEIVKKEVSPKGDTAVSP